MAPIKASLTAIDYMYSACALNKRNVTYYSVQALIGEYPAADCQNV